MGIALFVGGAFHGDLRAISHYKRTEIKEGPLRGTYVPCTMFSRRGSAVVLHCMVDVEVAYDKTERLKQTIDAMMRNVPCAEPYVPSDFEVA